MKHGAHPLLLDEVAALFMGCAPSTPDTNLVDVCVSIAGPVELVVDRRVVVGATGVEVEGGNVVLDELEEEVEGGGAFVLEEEEEEEVDVGGGCSWVVGPVRTSELFRGTVYELRRHRLQISDVRCLNLSCVRNDDINTIFKCPVKIFEIPSNIITKIITRLKRAAFVRPSCR